MTMKPTHDMRPPDVLELEAVIRDERHCGVVHIRVGLPPESRGRSAKALADEVAKRIGLNPIENAWRGIARSEAHQIITNFLERDLAYKSKLIEPERAKELANAVLSLADGTSSFFTNISAQETFGGTAWGWTPLTEATFDHAVLFLGSAAWGIIWVEDED